MPSSGRQYLAGCHECCTQYALQSCESSVTFCMHALVQTTDLPGSATIRGFVTSMGVPLYPDEASPGYAKAKARGTYVHTAWH